jgi:hypothetical protein
MFLAFEIGYFGLEIIVRVLDVDFESYFNL